ncbi:MAG: TlpA disulfide reductase family protein [Nitrospirota bacterium]
MRKLFLVIIPLILVFSFTSCKKGEDEEAEIKFAKTGSAAPEFTLKDINNKNVSLSDYRGKVVVIEFWATWCPACRASIPELVTVYNKYMDKDFTILAISINEGQDVQKKLVAFAKEFGMTYPVLLADMNTTFQYGVNSIPHTFIVDKESIIKNQYLGYQQGISETLSKEIEGLL